MKTYTNSFFNQSEGTSEKNNNLGPMRIYSFLDNNEVGKNKIILLRPKCNNLVLKHLFRGGQHGTKSPGYEKELTLPPCSYSFLFAIVSMAQKVLIARATRYHLKLTSSPGLVVFISTHPQKLATLTAKKTLPL